MFARTLIPVLMLVPYFAPQSHAAMFRAHKFARYLPEHGFKPIVVTTDVNYLYNNDPGLLGELPPEVEIHRARYVEPTLRGIRMALGGQDRSFATLKATGITDSAGGAVGKVSNANNWTQRSLGVGSVVAGLIGNYPDRHWTWTRPARRLSEKLIAQHNIKLLYTSANPVSFLRAALHLKRKKNLAWLFDARDPLGYGRKHTAKNAVGLLQERAILRSSMAAADHVVGLASSYGQIFFDLYGLPENRFDFIPTGVDQSYLAGSEGAAREDFLLHVGEVMPDQGERVFRVLERMLSQGADDPFGRLIFVGRREVNEPRVRRLVSGLNCLQDRMEFIDHCPQPKVYDLIRRARACLLVPGRTRYWWNNFAKMVDYIALGAPVIADVPEISEARNELTKVGTGFFLTDEIEADAEALRMWLAGVGDLAASDYGKRYIAKQQVSDLASILQRLQQENDL
jgi:glycosyltransferase involved in cell wall biosynthesis